MNTGHDLLAEQSVLSACMWSTAARKEARRHLTRGDFFDPAHQTIWDALTDLDREGKAIEAGTVAARLAGDRAADQRLLDIIGNHAMPESVATYAETVHAWSTRRRVWDEAVRAQQAASNPAIDASGLAAAVANRFANIRDLDAEDIQSITLGELLAQHDDPEDWVVPGLLERRDRLMLTGAEGLGKSYLLRQIAVMAAGGLHPFDFQRHIPPMRALIVDCENSYRQVRRKSRGIVEFTKKWSRTGDPEAVNFYGCGRIDILRDRDLSAIHREVDAIQPDIIVIGPIYAMSSKALMTDDDAVPVLAALDSLREGGAALLMEAHAGHTQGAEGRNFRPRGSSALLGWPEFGYGLRPVASGFADMVPWRGDRDQRAWPGRIKHDSDGIRWLSMDADGGSELDRYGRPA